MLGIFFSDFSSLAPASYCGSFFQYLTILLTQWPFFPSYSHHFEVVLNVVIPSHFDFSFSCFLWSIAFYSNFSSYESVPSIIWFKTLFMWIRLVTLILNSSISDSIFHFLMFIVIVHASVSVFLGFHISNCIFWFRCDLNALIVHINIITCLFIVTLFVLLLQFVILISMYFVLFCIYV